MISFTKVLSLVGIFLKSFYQRICQSNNWKGHSFFSLMHFRYLDWIFISFKWKKLHYDAWPFSLQFHTYFDHDMSDNRLTHSELSRSLNSIVFWACYILLSVMFFSFPRALPLNPCKAKTNPVKIKISCKKQVISYIPLHRHIRFNK